MKVSTMMKVSIYILIYVIVFQYLKGRSDLANKIYMRNCSYSSTLYPHCEPICGIIYNDDELKQMANYTTYPISSEVRQYEQSVLDIMHFLKHFQNRTNVEINTLYQSLYMNLHVICHRCMSNCDILDVTIPNDMYVFYIFILYSMIVLFLFLIKYIPYLC